MTTYFKNIIKVILEGMACYAGQFLDPAEAKAFLALWPIFFYSVLAHYRQIFCTVVTLITFSTNLSKF